MPVAVRTSCPQPSWGASSPDCVSKMTRPVPSLAVRAAVTSFVVVASNCFESSVVLFDSEPSTARNGTR